MIRDMEDLIVELVFVGNDDKLHIDTSFSFEEHEINPKLTERLREIVVQ